MAHLKPLSCVLCAALLQAPLFTLKAKLFADSTFVIGYDTAVRLIMPKYYGGEVNMLLELAAMRYRQAFSFFHCYCYLFYFFLIYYFFSIYFLLF